MKSEVKERTKADVIKPGNIVVSPNNSRTIVLIIDLPETKVAGSAVFRGINLTTGQFLEDYVRGHGWEMFTGSVTLSND